MEQSGLACLERSCVLYHAKLGWLCLLVGKPGEARRLFEECLSLAASFGVAGASVADAYAGLGECQARSGDRRSAIASLHMALQLSPSPPMRRAARARLARLLGRKTPAEEV